MSIKCVAVAIALSVSPVVAAAQTTPTDKAPTNPTANDGSYGTSMSPASMGSNPVSMDPQAARKEGTAPASSASNPTPDAKH